MKVSPCTIIFVACFWIPSISSINFKIVQVPLINIPAGWHCCGLFLSLSYKHAKILFWLLFSIFSIIFSEDFILLIKFRFLAFMFKIIHSVLFDVVCYVSITDYAWDHSTCWSPFHILYHSVSFWLVWDDRWFLKMITSCYSFLISRI